MPFREHARAAPKPSAKLGESRRLPPTPFLSLLEKLTLSTLNELAWKIKQNPAYRMIVIQAIEVLLVHKDTLVNLSKAAEERTDTLTVQQYLTEKVQKLFANFGYGQTVLDLTLRLYLLLAEGTKLDTFIQELNLQPWFPQEPDLKPQFIDYITKLHKLKASFKLLDPSQQQTHFNHLPPFAQKHLNSYLDTAYGSQGPVGNFGACGFPPLILSLALADSSLEELPGFTDRFTAPTILYDFNVAIAQGLIGQTPISKFKERYLFPREEVKLEYLDLKNPQKLTLAIQQTNPQQALLFTLLFKYDLPARPINPSLLSNSSPEKPRQCRPAVKGRDTHWFMLYPGSSGNKVLIAGDLTPFLGDKEYVEYLIRNRQFPYLAKVDNQSLIEALTAVPGLRATTAELQEVLSSDGHRDDTQLGVINNNVIRIRYPEN
jgi:hypothetical protein